MENKFKRYHWEGNQCFIDLNYHLAAQKNCFSLLEDKENQISATPITLFDLTPGSKFKFAGSADRVYTKLESIGNLKNLIAPYKCLYQNSVGGVGLADSSRVIFPID